MDPEKLPNSAQLLTSIINQLSTIESPSTAVGGEEEKGGQLEPTQANPTERSSRNPLSSLPADALSKAKSLLITLHCLFPNELLLALDILDKELVNKCNLGVSSSGDSNVSVLPRSNDVYFVRSQSTLEVEATDGMALRRSYEVHLQSWNCTCDAFTLAGLKAMDYDEPSEEDGDDDGDAQLMEDWHFGGTLTTRRRSMGPPAICCKHLLACVLVARCPNLFAQNSKELMVGSEETAATRMKDDWRRCGLAGWFAGWDG